MSWGQHQRLDSEHGVDTVGIYVENHYSMNREFFIWMEFDFWNLDFRGSGPCYWRTLWFLNYVPWKRVRRTISDLWIVGDHEGFFCSNSMDVRKSTKRDFSTTMLVTPPDSPLGQPQPKPGGAQNMPPKLPDLMTESRAINVCAQNMPHKWLAQFRPIMMYNQQ